MTMKSGKNMSHVLGKVEGKFDGYQLEHVSQGFINHNSSAGRSPSRCLKQYRYQSSLSGSQFLHFFGASCGLTPLVPGTVLSSAEIEAEGEQ